MAKKKFPIIENLLITSVAAEGVSLGRHNDYVIFVSGVIPGDIVDVQLTRMRKAYAESKLLKIREFSKDRIEPFCKHFGTWWLQMANVALRKTVGIQRKTSL